MRKLKLDELKRLSIEEFKAFQKKPVAIVLDNIRSAFNVGSIFRSADAFACEQIILCGITAKPPHKEINKSAIGATESVRWQYIPNVLDAVSELRSQDYTIIGIEQTDESIPLSEYDVDPHQKLAVVFGNEVEGLNKELLPLLNTCLEIKQFGTKHSLNVGVCAGIVLFDLVRRL